MKLPTICVKHPDTGEAIWVNQCNAHMYEPYEPDGQGSAGEDDQTELEEDDREAHLKAMPWTKLRAIAGALGIEKGDDQSWAEVIPQILLAEGAL